MISGIITGADLPTHFSTDKAQAACDAAFGAGVIQIVGQFAGTLPNITVQSVRYEQVLAGSVSVEALKGVIKTLACTAQETDAAVLVAKAAEPTLLERIAALEADVATLKAK